MKKKVQEYLDTRYPALRKLTEESGAIIYFEIEIGDSPNHPFGGIEFNREAGYFQKAHAPTCPLDRVHHATHHQ